MIILFLKNYDNFEKKKQEHNTKNVFTLKFNIKLYLTKTPKFKLYVAFAILHDRYTETRNLCVGVLLKINTNQQVL